MLKLLTLSDIELPVNSIVRNAHSVCDTVCSLRDNRELSHEKVCETEIKKLTIHKAIHDYNVNHPSRSTAKLQSLHAIIHVHEWIG